MSEHKDTAGIIERLEAAQEGSVELDAEVAWHCGGYREQLGDEKFEAWVVSCRCTNEFKYSRSIDAALSLVPEGWTVQQMDQYLMSDDPNRGDLWRCWLAYLDGAVARSAFGGARPTLPLSICIAALRARAHKGEG